ncbi:MAG: histidine phosphatase family protein [Vallitaleaceae bacterium]|nr:histidine phosphatase family protein [Vallitaleaceae bacterium]
MGKIYITRHGETEWNTAKRMQGQSNSPLTELGEKQAAWLAKRLEAVEFNIIYSSSLFRAIHTSNILKGDRPIDIIPTNALREIYLGSWQGCLSEDVQREDAQRYHCFWNEPESYIPGDGESFEELNQRVGVFFKELLQNHPNDNVLIVAHAVVLKALFNFINHSGTPKSLWDGPHIRPTCLTIINYENEQLSFEMIADTEHYEEVNTQSGWFLEDK